MTLLLIRPGSVHEEVRAIHGDFENWFQRVLDDDICWMDPTLPNAEPLPTDLSDYRGLVITGSHSSAYEDEPWIRALAALIRRAREVSLPMLGVCFGHQMIAEALGGRVTAHPNGSENGTVEIKTTAAAEGDSLLGHLPAVFEAQAAHNDHVVEIPPGAEILAFNDHSPVQAFRIGHKIHGVQFHPEVTAPIMRDMIDVIQERGDFVGDHQKAKARIRETPLAMKVLKLF